MLFLNSSSKLRRVFSGSLQHSLAMPMYLICITVPFDLPLSLLLNKDFAYLQHVWERNTSLTVFTTRRGFKLNEIGVIYA